MPKIVREVQYKYTYIREFDIDDAVVEKVYRYFKTNAAYPEQIKCLTADEIATIYNDIWTGAEKPEVYIAMKAIDDDGCEVIEERSLNDIIYMLLDRWIGMYGDDTSAPEQSSVPSSIDYIEHEDTVIFGTENE